MQILHYLLWEKSSEWDSRRSAVCVCIIRTATHTLVLALQAWLATVKHILMTERRTDTSDSRSSSVWLEAPPAERFELYECLSVTVQTPLLSCRLTGGFCDASSDRVALASSQWTIQESDYRNTTYGILKWTHVPIYPIGQNLYTLFKTFIYYW